MTARPIVFVDTETTCLGPLARPWEVAIIRREPDGDERTRLVQVAYPLNGLPEGTDPAALQLGGWLTRGVRGSTYWGDLPDDVTSTAFCEEKEAAHAVASWLRHRPILVGVGVHFDAAVLSALFQRHSLDPEPWHYAIVDLKAATWGYLQGHDAALGHEGVPHEALPPSSEALSRAIGVEPPVGDERHTALGDAHWAARWFDRLAGGAR
jgi:hypothetical protein